MGSNANWDERAGIGSAPLVDQSLPQRQVSGGPQHESEAGGGEVMGNMRDFIERERGSTASVASSKGDSPTARQDVNPGGIATLQPLVEFPEFGSTGIKTTPRSANVQPFV